MWALSPGGPTYRRHLLLPTQVHSEHALLPRSSSLGRRSSPRITLGDGRTPSFLESHQEEFSNLTPFLLATLQHAPSHTGSQAKPLAQWENVPRWEINVPK